MKTVLCQLALMAGIMIPATAGAQEGNLHLKGDVKGLRDSLIVLFEDVNNGVKRDTVLVKDGKFEFTVHVPRPTILTGCTPGTLRNEEMTAFRVIAVPGESAVITGDLNDHYYLDGSTFYKQYNEADRFTEPAKQRYIDWMKEFQTRIKAGESYEKLMNESQEKVPALEKGLTDAIMQFIKEHPSYEASATLIPELPDVKLMKEAAVLLDPEVREGRMKSYVQSFIERIEADLGETEASLESGTPAPDFTLNDINGKPLTLSSLRGKYVVLDFWGSWCIWCIKGMPEMKKYYEKYKGKFEILGIDCNEPQNRWKDAVKKHELPWLHVYNPDNSKLLADYGVSGFPTKVIVDPDGNIVKTIVGEDPKFYTLLDELLGK